MLILSVSRSRRLFQQGFSLLEMMVVLVLVGMISAMLMQGFIYVAGVFGSVERRQQHWQQQMLQRSWLTESIRSLTNGVDGPLAQSLFFSGDANGFSGLALQGLSYAGGVGRPVRIEWQLQRGEDQQLILRYRETGLTQEFAQATDSLWYTVARWPRAEGRIRYFSNGQWSQSFSGRPLANQASPRLPAMIVLSVEAGPRSLEVWVSPSAPATAYSAPDTGNDD